MKVRIKIFAALAILLAGAIVFSPLLAALGGTGLDARHLADAFGSAPRPLVRSIGMAFISGLVSLLWGVPFALLVDRSSPALRRILWSLGLMVLMVPPYIVAEAWIVLLGPVGKISRSLAVLFGLGPHTTDPIELARFSVPGLVFTWPTVGIIMGGCLFPIVALSVASAYRRTDHRVFESARLAQGRRGVFQVAVRILIAPSIGAALLVFAATLTEFAVPQLLRVRTLGELIYEQIQNGDLAAAAALGLSMLPLVVIAGAVGVVVLLRSRSASMAGLEGEVPKFTGATAGPPGQLAACVMAVAAITTALILPIISLTWLTVTAKLPQASSTGMHKLLRASGFFDSLKGAWDLAQNDAIRTVILAGVAALLAVALAVVMARIASSAGWGSSLGALGAGLAVPAPVIGLGLIALWDHGAAAAIYESLVIVLLAWFARFFPLVVFLVQAALARVPRELENAAALAGRGPVERIFTVTLRGAAPGLVAAWLVMYVLSATEFSTTVLITPPGQPLIAPSVVNLMRRGQDPEIAACQFLLLAVVATPLFVIAGTWLARRAFR